MIGGDKYDDILKIIKDYQANDCNIDVYKVLWDKDYSDKYKMDQFVSINININTILNKYYGHSDKIYFKHFKDDMIFVLILDKIAIKIYSTSKFERIKELYEILKINENPHLEHICEIIYNHPYNYVIVVSETLEIHDIITKITEDDITKQIINGSLQYLHKKGWIHNDVNFDNIGYRRLSCTDEPDKVCLVLYDFEKSKKLLNPIDKQKDFDDIKKSFIFHNITNKPK